MKKDQNRFKRAYFLLLRHFLLLMMIISFTSCESRRVIVNGLDEKEANEILVFLSNKDIDAYKVQAISEAGGGSGKAILWNVSVKHSQSNEAMALLNQIGLPRRRGQNLLGIFSNVGLVPSGMQEKIRYQAGLAEQIASTIRKIDGVLDADVQISFPDEDVLNPMAVKQKITASVYVKHSGVLDDPNAHLMTRIKRLVAGSVNGLDYDNVTIIGDRARFSESPAGSFQGSFGDEELPYVSIWSIIVAKDTLTRFQLIFFSFTLIILTLLLLLLFLLWKIYPLLKKSGGIKRLLSIRPIDEETENPEAADIKNQEQLKKEENADDEDGIT